MSAPFVFFSVNICSLCMCSSLLISDLYCRTNLVSLIEMEPITKSMIMSIGKADNVDSSLTNN